MKYLTIPVLLLVCAMSFAQDINFDYQALNKKYEDKVATIDSTIETLYAVISGEKGEERNAELLRYLFHPKAKLIASGQRKDSSYASRFLTIDHYVENSLPWMFENGFYEKELHRVTEQFGQIAHVFSSYETFYSKEDDTPFMRGINSIQLMFTGKRWVVLSVYFTQETEDNPIPEKYLPKEK